MVEVLALSGVAAVALSLAARTAWRAVDPPYRGIHRPDAGRHREREWETGECPLVRTS